MLIHIEIQGQRERDFPERKFCYSYRLCDSHHRLAVSLALLCDDRPNGRPTRFEAEVSGCFPLQIHADVHRVLRNMALVAADVDDDAVKVGDRESSSRSAPEVDIHLGIEHVFEGGLPPSAKEVVDVVEGLGLANNLAGELLGLEREGSVPARISGREVK